MSFSLNLEHGDIALSGTSLGTVTDAAKLQQDLVCAILTPLGFDELHPTFGSTLVENLFDPDGSDIFGTTDFSHAATVVYSELVRLCHNYQLQQIARNSDDANKFGRYSLVPGEILVAVKGINFTQVETTLIAELDLEIGNDSVQLNVPIPQEATN